MKNFIQPGRVLNYTPGSAVAVGAVVVIGKRIGIASADIAANATGALEVQGVWALPLAGSITAGIGDLAYWDATNKNITTTSSSNTLAGYFAAPAASGDATAQIKINA